ASYPLHAPEPRAAEQDPEDWWRAIGTMARQVLAGVEPGRLAAVGISAHGPSVVAADADLRPTMPSLTWLDGRTDAEAQFIHARVARPPSVWGSFPARALWMARRWPEAL